MTQPPSRKQMLSRLRSLDRPIRLALVLGLAALIIIVSVLVWKANPKGPDLDSLKHISLEIPKVEVASKPLATLLAMDGGMSFGAHEELLRGALDNLRGGRWLQEPNAVLDALGTVKAPSVAEAERALLAPGCLPKPQGFSSTSPSYSYVIHFIRLLAVRGVAQVQRGEAEAGASSLVRLFDRIFHLEQRCRPNLIATMVLTSSFGLLRSALGFLLATPTLPDQTQRAIWSRLQRLEGRGSPMPDAMRHEGQFMLGALKQVAKTEGKRPSLQMWPWYDPKETMRFTRHLARRRVWLAELALDSSEWSRRLPEDAYIKKLEEQEDWMIYFRKNGMGKMLLAMASARFRLYILRWHRDRCLAAAHRASWATELVRRGRKPPTEATNPAPVDPFSRKRFASDGPGVEHCAVSKKRFRHEMAGVELVQLPEVPAVPKAPSGQASTPPSP